LPVFAFLTQSLLKKANKNLSYKLCNQKLFPAATKKLTQWHNWYGR
jgi:hypothetical protein